MGKSIKTFNHLSKDLQAELYSLYIDGALERTVFSYKGNLEEGILFMNDNDTFLVPISSITAFKTLKSGEEIEGVKDHEELDLDEE